jgi:hypothetical protein
VIGTRGRLGLVMLAVVGGGVATATTSDAATGPLCFGDTFAAVCVTVDPSALPTVNPTGGPGFHDCVFAGPPPCTPVDVPGPAVVPGSGAPLVAVQCTGAASPCPNPTSLPTPTPTSLPTPSPSPVPTPSISMSPTPTPSASIPAVSLGGMSIAGTGTVSPGLTQAGDPGQTFTFGGSGAVATTTQHDTINCNVTGNDTIGSWNQGSGGFSGNCTGSGGGSSSVTGTYTRIGSAVTVSITATKTNAGGFSGALNGSCGFSPSNVDPNTQRITGFTLTCVFAITESGT